MPTSILQEVTTRMPSRSGSDDLYDFLPGAGPKRLEDIRQHLYEMRESDVTRYWSTSVIPVSSDFRQRSALANIVILMACSTEGLAAVRERCSKKSSQMNWLMRPTSWSSTTHRLGSARSWRTHRHRGDGLSGLRTSRAPLR